MSKPFDKIKVLDFTRVLAGPYCTMLLGDLGAEIIKVESPGQGDDSRLYGPPFIDKTAIYFISINRDKKSIVINLKTEEGIKIIKELIRQVDVLVENFRPGTMEKLGLDYDSIKKINPKIIYASCSGFGHSGPDKNKPGYDLIAQALGGMMSITSYKENGPFTKVGVSEADIIAGIILAFGIAARLYRRECDGKGDKIDVSMLDCQIAILTPMVAAYLNTGAIAKPAGSSHGFIAPFDTFDTQTGQIAIAAGNDKLFFELCDVLNLPALKNNPLFKTNSQRVINKRKLKKILNNRCKKFTLESLLKLLQEKGIPASKINNIKEAVEEPQVSARNMLQTVKHKKMGEIKLQGIPIKFDSCDDNLKLPPPLHGEHTAVILKKYLNYDNKKIKQLLKDNVIEIEEV